MQLLDCRAHGVTQVALVVLGDKVGHGFSVGLALELDTVSLQGRAQFLVIL